MNALGNNGGRMSSFANQPVLINCNFTVNNASTLGLGTTTLQGQGIRNVFMHTTQTPGTHRGYLNPNPAAGYALVQLESNYNRLLSVFPAIIQSPTTGSSLVTNSTALSVGVPYVINSVGVGPAGTATIAPVADVSGSLASKYFTLYDSYGNIFAIWFNVSGVGSAPLLGNAALPGVPGLKYIQQSITSGATAATIGAALVLTINNLPSGINGLMSFTSSGTTTVTVVSTATQPLAGVPQDGTTGLTTGFTFALTVSDTVLGDWQAIGLPKGLTPTVGQSFFATATGAGNSTGTVLASGLSGIVSTEIIGQPNTQMALQPQGGSPHTGGFVLVKFLAPTSSSVTTPIVTAPANGSVVNLSFYVDFKLSPSNQSTNGT